MYSEIFGVLFRRLEPGPMVKQARMCKLWKKRPETNSARAIKSSATSAVVKLQDRTHDAIYPSDADKDDGSIGWGPGSDPRETWAVVTVMRQCPVQLNSQTLGHKRSRIVSSLGL